MLSKLKKIFSTKPQNKSQSIPKTQLELEEIEVYFIREMEKSTFIHKKHHALVLRHLRHEEKINPTSVPEIFNVKENEALLVSSEIKKIYNKATIEREWDKKFIGLYTSGITKATLISSGHNEHCDFCTSQFGKELLITSDTYAEFKEHCTCKPYKKSFLSPEIRFN